MLCGPHKGRIVNVDDQEEGIAICYFGTILAYVTSADLPFEQLRPVTTQNLLERSAQISRIINPPYQSTASHTEQLDALYEYNYIANVLRDRWDESEEQIRKEEGMRIFISHSSKDKTIARWIGVDLANLGYRPWLDEWEIRVGESIPTKISQGLDNCDAVVLLLSPHAVESGWVEREWQAKYWDEVSENSIKVIPVLLSECTIPTLLKMKRYADFRQDPAGALREISEALRGINNPNRPS